MHRTLRIQSTVPLLLVPYEPHSYGLHMHACMMEIKAEKDINSHQNVNVIGFMFEDFLRAEYHPVLERLDLARIFPLTFFARYVL
jgi:hypothetical protein